jgi:hypothetical protein
MIIEHEECPKYLWGVLLLVALLNFIRGFLHTFMVEFAATNIAGLDLSVSRNELLNLMNVYGWSNIIEGILYLVIALKHRNLAPLALTLAGLFIPFTAVTTNLANISLSGADWGGAPLMLFIYTPLCLIPVILFYIQKYRNR